MFGLVFENGVEFEGLGEDLGEFEGVGLKDFEALPEVWGESLLLRERLLEGGISHGISAP